MGKEPEYLTVGKTPLERVHKLLSKIDSIRRSKERGSVVLETEKDLANNYVGQIESIFKNLPKPLKTKIHINSLSFKLYPDIGTFPFKNTVLKLDKIFFQ